MMKAFREAVRELNEAAQLLRRVDSQKDDHATAASPQASLAVRPKQEPSPYKLAIENRHLQILSERQLAVKRISVDLTTSDDDRHDSSHNSRKIRKLNHDCSSSSSEDSETHYNNSRGPTVSSGIQIVIPRRSPPPVGTYATRTVEYHSRRTPSAAQIEYAKRLQEIPGPPVTLRNDLDNTTPPTNFKFINEYVFGLGTKRVDKEFITGCNCREENGRSIGCEYLYCECLEDSARGENGKVLGFPYYGAGQKKGCLREMFLSTRYPIYECNDLCRCRSNCRSRVVQKGRQVRLEIFKTENRGWGLRSTDTIKKGQFIDIYLGEVITDAEATRREHAVKDSYLYSLDKFQGTKGEPDYIPTEDLYVVDGELMGGPTRFINHSCDPNCRQFTVSKVRGDTKVYELAFFALDVILAGTELTFDYVDKDYDEEDEDEEITEDNVKDLEQQKDRPATKCLCGSPFCRKYLWL